MTSADRNELLEVCAGNADAADFLAHWIGYVHAVDDLCDGHQPVEHAPAMFAAAATLYGSPFYRQHAATLAPIVLLLTNTYEDANRLALSDHLADQSAADVLRHCGGEMVRAVALLCGGYQHLQRVSARQLTHVRRRETHHEPGRVIELLVTVRQPELLDAATLTLNTVRTGFPSGRLLVQGNALPPELAALVERRASDAGGEFINLPPQRHDHWLLWRIESCRHDELVILDGDLVFHRDCSGLPAPKPITGPHEPQHLNPITAAIHLSRLHTCFWRVDPVATRRVLLDARHELPRIPHVMPWHPTAQTWRWGFPHSSFSDSGAELCRVAQAIAFGPDYDDAFTHLHCGTWSDVAAAHLPDLPALHAAAAAGRLTETDYAGIRRQQAQWYADHAA